MTEIDTTGVHRTHCCALHGCKYANDGCPVANWKIAQDFPCQSCPEYNDLGQGDLLEIEVTYGGTLNVIATVNTVRDAVQHYLQALPEQRDALGFRVRTISPWREMQIPRKLGA
jgi:hypothetical protein